MPSSLNDILGRGERGDKGRCPMGSHMEATPRVSRWGGAARPEHSFAHDGGRPLDFVGDSKYTAAVATSGSLPARRVGFFRSLWIAMRAVFHETTGTLFLLLALSWASATFRLWNSGAKPWVCAACGSFGFVLVGLGISSFRAAKRVR